MRVWGVGEDRNHVELNKSGWWDRAKRSIPIDLPPQVAPWPRGSGTSEDGAFWLAFLRSVADRGLSGVELVTPADPGRYPDPHRPRPYHGWYIWHDGLGLGAASSLPSLFDQFAERWWHPDTQLQTFWRNVLRGLVYTYTDAERMDESRGVVPACTALETLCWAILVETEGWLTGGRPTDGGDNEFDKLTAAGQMRLLLRWAGIPTGLPGGLNELSQKARSSNWDGPQVVVWVRNRVVHPDRRDQLTDGIATESLRLAMLYAELVILKLLGYDGYFRDRLDAGGIKRVPWATE